MYRYGLIGNCQASALVSEMGSIDWLCLPRPDSPPVFGKLLDPEGGQFEVLCAGAKTSRQEYIPNTNILQTFVQCEDGEYKITDFFPRFQQHGRVYRPMSLFRIVEPVRGSPAIRVSCRPVNGWEKERVQAERGNSHLRFDIRGETLRLTTNMPLTYLCDETLFTLNQPLYFGLTWSLGIEEDLVQVTQSFLEQTRKYWITWVQHCSIPSQYQNETIRSALALKLHCYEDTGAILAGLTTSLPEEKSEGRNWDYRFCWLRDAYFVLSAFHALGQFEEMEGFLEYLLNLAQRSEHTERRLHPVYKLDQSLPLPEHEHPNWAGFDGARPVRSNNQAAEHVQNDVYGEMVLTLAPIFFDQRFQHLRTNRHQELLEHLARKCIDTISEPDAGLWELRNGWQEHTFSNLMSWAGIERIRRIRSMGYLKGLLNLDLDQSLDKAEKAVLAALKDGSIRNGPTDSSHDAALLQLPILRFPDGPICRQTVLDIANGLHFPGQGKQSGYLYRYLREDDFGRPKSAFLICSFWLVQALARVGEMEQARGVMAEIMGSANALGLFSEHYLPGAHLQAGNFPQAYSHVGQINAAFMISPTWENVL